MNQKSLPDTDFDALLKGLPSSLDLDASARTRGALRRRRGVRDAASLLRLALVYATGTLSLRGTAAWASVGAVAELSDVALLNRLRGSADWLEEIVAALLAERVATAAGTVAAPSNGAAAGRVMRLVDATCLSAPGSRKTDWRLHVACRLGATVRIEQVVLSDGRGAESLERFACAPGEVMIGDRGYAKAEDLARLQAGGGEFIVRTGWNAVRLRTPEGAPFDLFGALDGLAEHGTTSLAPALALDRGGRALVPVRLVAFRLDEAQAAENRRRARANSRRQGKTPKAETLAAAGYMLLLTSLDSAAVSDQEILALYHLRWQIELVFKRLKSLLDLDLLPAKDPDLARCWICAKLIVALLLEDMTGPMADSPPWGQANRLAVAGPASAVRDRPVPGDHRAAGL